MSTLSTEQAPPISVPFRYFAAAPLFLLLAAAILAGSDPFSDPASPAMLAATHCITIGFIGMIMMGALQQILPVMIGSQMPAPSAVAGMTFLLIICGTLSLSAGFLLKNPDLLGLAWPLLGAGFVIFIAASLISLSRAQARNITRTAILLSVLALTGAVTLGALLAHAHACGMPIDYEKLAGAHIALALGGWVMLLIVGVSYQVVPMFQLTPNYPKRPSHILAPALFLAVLLALSSFWFDIVFAQALFWLLAASFALITLRLQYQRRRRIKDATLSFFRLGMICLLTSALLSFAALPAPCTTLTIILFVLGFAMSVICGMLYKIVPFLVWFHLFRGGISKGVPNMKQIIPEVWMHRHLWLHIAVLLCLLLTVTWPAAIYLVAGGLALEGLLLCLAMYTALRIYHRTRQP